MSCFWLFKLPHSHDPLSLLKGPGPTQSHAYIYIFYSEETLEGIISGSTKLETVLQNDIYGQYRLLPDPEHNEGKLQTILVNWLLQSAFFFGGGGS